MSHSSLSFELGLILISKKIRPFLPFELFACSAPPMNSSRTDEMTQSFRSIWFHVRSSSCPPNWWNIEWYEMQRKLDLSERPNRKLVPRRCCYFGTGPVLARLFTERGQRDKWSIASCREIVQKNCPANRTEFSITAIWGRTYCGNGAKLNVKCVIIGSCTNNCEYVNFFYFIDNRYNA